MKYKVGSETLLGKIERITESVVDNSYYVVRDDVGNTVVLNEQQVDKIFLNSQCPQLTPSEKKALKRLIDGGCKTIRRVNENVMEISGPSIDSLFEEFEMKINVLILHFFPETSLLPWLTTDPINLKELLEEREEK